MDPASSIITIIDTSLKITGYIKDVSHGGKERQILNREILSIYQIFLSLQDQFSTEGWAADTPWVRSIRPLLQSGGTIHQLRLTLDEIAEKLTAAPQDYVTRTKRALKWPFDKDQIRDITSRIEHHKSLITVALGQANVELGKEANLGIAYVKDTMDAQTLFNTLNWISPLDFRAMQQSSQKKPVEGTGRWFLTDPRFQGWASGRVPLIWCHGIPGAGKTLLASAAFSHMLQQNMDRKAVLIAFCSFDEQRTYTAQDVLASLLRQVIQLSDQVSESMKKLYNEYATGKKQAWPNLEQVCDALNSELAKLDETFVILDGLDEIPAQKDREELLRCLGGLEPRPKLMATSRPLPEIRSWFTMHAKDHGFGIDEDTIEEDGYEDRYWNRCDACPDQDEREMASYECKSCDYSFCTSCYDNMEKECPGCGKEQDQVCWTLPKAITIAAQPEDLKCYIDWRINTSKTLREHVAKTTRCDLRQVIVTRVLDDAKDMFLLAKFHMNVLVDQLTPRDVLNALETLPKGVNDIYDGIFRRIEGYSSAATIRKFIAIIARAKSLLSVAALEEAVAVQPGDIELDEMSTCDVRHLASLCIGLVEVDSSNFVRFAHETIGHYIDQHSHETFRESETLLAEICLTYLRFPVFADTKDHKSDRYIALEQKKEYSPFLSYAARHWGEHARESKDADILDLVMEFLSESANVQTAVQVMSQDNSDSWNSWDADEGATGLHLAAYYGLTQAASRLLSLGADPDARDCLDTTPLMYAASAGRSEIVELLLHAGAKPYLVCRIGRTALHRACQNQQVVVIRQLVASKHDIAINARDARFSHWTALEWAVYMGPDEIVEVLLTRKDIDVNAMPPDHFHHNALHCAALEGFSETVEVLLTHPAIDIDALDATGRTALILAASNGREEVIKQLLDKGAQLEIRDSHGGTALLRAIDFNSLGSVRLLVSRGADCGFRDFLGRNILHGAAINGRASILQYLLSEVKDLDPNSRGNRGETPLHDAVYYGYNESIRVLLSFGARTDALDNTGRSAARVGRDAGRDGTLPLLREARLREIEEDRIKARADVFEPTKLKRPDTFGADYKMPIHSAVRLLDEEALQSYLTSLGPELEASIHKIDNDMLQTPLHVAARRGKSKAARFLLENGASVNFQDMWGWTPLHVAAEMGHTDIAAQLLDHDAALDILDDQKRSPLEFATSQFFQPHMAFLLIKRGAFFDKYSWNLVRLLLWAAKEGDLDVIKRLIAAGVPFQLKGDDGLSAYQQAKQNGHTEVAEFLFREGEVKKGVSSHTPNVENGVKSIKDVDEDVGQDAVPGDIEAQDTKSASEEDFVIVKSDVKMEDQSFAEKAEQKLVVRNFGLTGRESILLGVIVMLITLLVKR